MAVESVALYYRLDVQRIAVLFPMGAKILLFNTMFRLVAECIRSPIKWLLEILLG
jgi:hypothetical protein